MSRDRSGTLQQPVVQSLPIATYLRHVVLLALVVVAASAPGLAPAQSGQGEITPYCLPSPIPTEPGPHATQVHEFVRDSGALKVLYWRQPCSDGDGQLIVTFIPTFTGAPFVCGGGRDAIIQDGRETSGFRYVRTVDGRATERFCGFVTEPTSVMIDVYDPDFSFDDDAELTIRTVWGSDVDPSSVSFTVAPYVNQPASPYLYPHGHFSGSYYDPTRPGEGVVLELSEVGERRILLISWYTYNEGQPLWIIGNCDFQISDQAIAVSLGTYTGARFGSEFDPSDVVATPWGSVLVSFPDCQHVNLDWRRDADGLTGTYAYTRTMERLNGTACGRRTTESAFAPD